MGQHSIISPVEHPQSLIECRKQKSATFGPAKVSRQKSPWSLHVGPNNRFPSQFKAPLQVETKSRHKMMQFPTILTFALYLLTVTPMVEGRIYYQLVIYAKNPPNGALDKITSNSTFFAEQLLPLLPEFKLLAPGQYESRRELQGEVEEESAPSLRGVETESRDLAVAGSQCPSSCSEKYSTYCRNCGCYSSSRRRRLLVGTVLSCADALLKETLINVQLLPYCGLKLFCSITAKVMTVSLDGTIAPVC